MVYQYFDGTMKSLAVLLAFIFENIEGNDKDMFCISVEYAPGMVEFDRKAIYINKGEKVQRVSLLKEHYYYFNTDNDLEWVSKKEWHNNQENNNGIIDQIR